MKIILAFWIVVTVIVVASLAPLIITVSGIKVELAKQAATISTLETKVASSTEMLNFLSNPDEHGVTGFTKAVYNSLQTISAIQKANEKK